jgi:hypothetical protein
MNLRSTKLTTPIVQLSSAIALTCAAVAGVDASAPVHHTCRQGDRGRLIGYEKVASHPTPHDARAHFEEWVAFYQDFFNFPENLPVTFEYGFDSYKVTYCTDDAVLPGQSFARTTSVTGMVSVPRKSGPLPTVAYVHGTSTSFYDAPSNPNTFGDFNPRGESFEGPPSTAVFAGNGFIYIAPDYLGLGDSTVPRHRYFMRHFFDDIAAELPPPVSDLLTPSYLAQLTTNRDNPMRVRLRENAVDRFRLEAPVRVYHSPVDEEVAYDFTLVSVERLRRRGATITVRTLPGFDHVNSWIQALPRAVR